jgi:His/Glu/Gln/Arg/opine family amino acid ABC transporter permease subunit
MTPELPLQTGRPRERRVLRLTARVLSVLLLIVFTLFALYWLLSQSYPFRWRPALQHLAQFNQGLSLTLQISLVAMVLGMTLGLLIALLRLAPFALLRDMGTLYVHTLRNIPFLVFILFTYFGVARAMVNTGAYVPLPLLGELDARLFWGIFALSLFEASFISEIFRAGIQSIHPTQMEAARSLGMNYFQAMRYVILPQAFRVIIPPMTGELIALVKESALLMVISLPELTLTAKQLASQKPLQFEFYTILAAYYLSITLPLAGLSHLLERKLKIAGREER